jgi:hypothetical protein
MTMTVRLSKKEMEFISQAIKYCREDAMIREDVLALGSETSDGIFKMEMNIAEKFDAATEDYEVSQQDIQAAKNAIGKPISLFSQVN